MVRINMQQLAIPRGIPLNSNHGESQSKLDLPASAITPADAAAATITSRVELLDLGYNKRHKQLFHTVTITRPISASCIHYYSIALDVSYID